MMDALFLDILNMAIAASWLILAVIAVRFVFRKAPKAIRVVLWSLVGLRLAWPFSWESVLSLIPCRETISPAVLQDAIPAIHSGFPIVNQAVNPLLSESLAPSVGASASPLQVITTVAAAVWLAGVAVLLLHSVISTVRLRRCVADAVRLEGNLWPASFFGQGHVKHPAVGKVRRRGDIQKAALAAAVDCDQAADRPAQAPVRRRDADRAGFFRNDQTAVREGGDRPRACQTLSQNADRVRGCRRGAGRPGLAGKEGLIISVGRVRLHRRQPDRFGCGGRAARRRGGGGSCRSRSRGCRCLPGRCCRRRRSGRRRHRRCAGRQQQYGQDG